jgi:hypothetical protein
MVCGVIKVLANRVNQGACDARRITSENKACSESVKQRMWRAEGNLLLWSSIYLHCLQVVRWWIPVSAR